MSMFGITTFMFSLGILALVLEATFVYQMNSANDTSYVIWYFVWATMTCLTVRLRDSFLPSD
jgi:hypothetical protein